MYWRLRAKDFSGRKVGELREGLRGLTNRAAAGDGPAPGLVALRDEGTAIGWVSLGPREDYERLERSRTIPRLDEAAVWSIVCFAVSRDARGEGVGAALLDAAVDWARDRGGSILEAYPVDVPSHAALPADAAFTGTTRMFERAGFERVADTASTAGGFPRVIVRRRLDSPGPPSPSLTESR